jgi:hypothetical protein
VLARRPRATAVRDREQVGLERVVRREPRGEHRRGEEDQHEGEADDRARVADESVERLVPQAARRVELDLSGFGFGDAHE